ncbi:hypothetical protein G3480_12845 [Thiorhodococcus mannitoliphagus]|uniref:Uncharacterized protein n=1 Tax=Thiorhodococcus mannitoliphagus TaxID=329406 RepID=A0A6P1DUN6_9GAMM|nr:hypothetical protein [Thiorhodococcus mannitoliphagus]NEX21190.1 hypothetical protein [Thiorhodococcus mannitoliphagus]
MIRDYKFKPTEWTIRKKRRFSASVFVKLLILAVLCGTGYGAYLWLTTSETDEDVTPAVEMTAPSDSRVIRLQLPPKPSAGAAESPD